MHTYFILEKQCVALTGRMYITVIFTVIETVSNYCCPLTASIMKMEMILRTTTEMKLNENKPNFML